MKGGVKKDYYDLIFGFGSPFFRAVECNKKAKHIFFMTENPYYRVRKAEDERCKYYEIRHGVRPSKRRSGREFRENDEKKCENIITFGDKRFIENENVMNVIRIFPTGLVNKNYIPVPYKRNRKHFLVLGSDGFILNGYDLLMDIFSRHTEWTLHFCGGRLLENLKELDMRKPDNVIYYEYVFVKSDKFIELCNLCSAVVLFSCSEGMPTSILTGMRAGLVPITCRGIGMDVLEPYIIFAEDYQLETIEKTMEKFTEMDADSYCELSNKIYNYANYYFSLDHFEKAFRSSIERLT